MEVIPWTGQAVPDAGFVGAELRKMGYGVSANPLAKEQQSPMLNSLNGEQLLWMVKGRVDLSIEKKLLTLNAGDRLTIPKGLKYHLKAKSQEGAFYLLGQK